MAGILVCGFMGIGKAYSINLFEKKAKVLNTTPNVTNDDEDADTKLRDYIKYMTDSLELYDIVYFPYNPDVVRLLEIENIHFDLFYPSKERQNEFLTNLVIKHLKSKDIKEFDHNFKDWIDSIDADNNEYCHKHCLDEYGEFIGNNPLINTYVDSLKK